MPKPWNAQPGRLTFPALEGVPPPEQPPIPHVPLEPSTGIEMSPRHSRGIWISSEDAFEIIIRGAVEAGVRGDFQLHADTSLAASRLEAHLRHHLPGTLNQTVHHG